MKSKWLFVACLLSAFGTANLTAGHALPPVIAKAKHMPVLQDAAAMLNKYGRGLGRGVVIIGSSLLLICGLMGCGSDDMDEAPQEAIKVATADAVSEDIAEGGAYEPSDYLGNYVAFISGGDGAIETGYVTAQFSLKNEIQVRLDEAERREDDSTIGLREVVGVMYYAHALEGKEVSFKRMHGAMPGHEHGAVEDWWKDLLPNILYGTVDVVYIEAVLPEGSGEPTAVGVTVHSGDNGARRVQARLPYTVFLPFNRIEFVDASE